MTSQIQIAFRNVMSNWRPSFAAILSVAAGFASLSLFQGYVSDIDAIYQNGFRHRGMYGDLVIEDPALHMAGGRTDSQRFFISAPQQAEIDTFLAKHSNDVTARVRFLTASGTITNGLSSFIFLAMGYDLEEGARVRAPEWTWESIYGQTLLGSKDPDAVILGQALGALMGCQPTPKRKDLFQNRGYAPVVRPFACERASVQLSTMTLSGQVNAMEVNVVGLIDGGYREVDERWLKTSLTNVQTLLNTDKIRFLTVLLKEPEKRELIRAEFNRFAVDAGINARAVHWVDHSLGRMYRQTKNLLNIFQGFIVTVVLIIVSLSVFNTMIKNVKERTREIGTLRSLGFTGRYIAGLFCWEAVFIALIGSLTGLFLTVLVTTALNSARISYQAGLLSEAIMFRIQYDVQAYLLCFALLATLSILASLLAVRGPLKNHIASNLAYV